MALATQRRRPRPALAAGQEVREVREGDCRDVLAGMPAATFDAVVTDPPYELTGQYGPRPPRYGNGTGAREARAGGFLGMRWDATGVAFDPATWALVLRSTRPGGYLLAFGGTRTAHRMVCAVEDAGWQVIDSIMWVHGQGFPKGQGQLKPAHEPICLARRPGAVRPLGIEACRVGTGEDRASGGIGQPVTGYNGGWGIRTERPTGGRWPTNLLLGHSPECVPAGERRVPSTKPGGRSGPATATYRGGWGDHRAGGHLAPEGYGDADGCEVVEDTAGCVEGCPVAELDRQSGVSVSSGGDCTGFPGPDGKLYGPATEPDDGPFGLGYGDVGGASRYFPTFRYAVKARRAERERGLIGVLPCVRCGGLVTTEHRATDGGTEPCRRNDHLTVKPVALCRWLVRLACPPGGRVLDPFAGSGSIGVAAGAEGFGYLGIEREPWSVRIARARMAAGVGAGDEEAGDA